MSDKFKTNTQEALSEEEKETAALAGLELAALSFLRGFHSFIKAKFRPYSSWQKVRDDALKPLMQLLTIIIAVFCTCTLVAFPFMALLTRLRPSLQEKLNGLMDVVSELIFSGIQSTLQIILLPLHLGKMLVNILLSLGVYGQPNLVEWGNFIAEKAGLLYEEVDNFFSEHYKINPAFYLFKRPKNFAHIKKEIVKAVKSFLLTSVFLVFSSLLLIAEPLFLVGALLSNQDIFQDLAIMGIFLPILFGLQWLDEVVRFALIPVVLPLRLLSMLYKQDGEPCSELEQGQQVFAENKKSIRILLAKANKPQISLSDEQRFRKINKIHLKVSQLECTSTPPSIDLEEEKKVFAELQQTHKNKDSDGFTRNFIEYCGLFTNIDNEECENDDRRQAARHA